MNFSWQKVLKGTILTLVFLLPLFFLTTSFEAFEYNKVYLLFLLTSVGLIAWLARMVFEDKKLTFKTSPMDLFVLALMLVAILSAVFSVDSTSSIFGFYGRFWPSLVGILSLGVFYFLLTNNVSSREKKIAPLEKSEPAIGEETEEIKEKPKKEKKDKLLTVNRIIKTFLWSSFFVVLITYLSLFGFWGKIAPSIGVPQIMSTGLFSPVGNSAGQIAVFTAIVFILLAVRLAFRGKFEEVEKETKSKSVWLYVFLVAMFLLLIILDVWQAWLVVGVSLLFFLAFSFWKRIFKEDVNKLSLSVLFLIISLIFLFSNPLQGVIGEINVFSNLSREATLSQGTSWQVGFEGMKESPVLGSGEGTFNYTFAKHKPDSFLESPFWQIRFDRAGNNVAEMLGTMGILGILSFLALVGMFLFVSWLVITSSAKQAAIKRQLPVLLAFFALLVSQFVFYQNATLAFLFFLFLGLGTVSWEKPQKEKSFSFDDFPEIGLVITILFWVILIGVGLLYFVMGKHYVADMYYLDYLKNSNKNIEKLESAASLHDGRAIYHMSLSRAYVQRLYEDFQSKQAEIQAGNQQASQQIVTLAAMAIREAQSAVQVSPNRIAAYQNLATVYRDIQGLAQGATDWAIRAFRNALELEPKNPVIMTELGKFLINSDNKEEARQMFEKALSLRSDYVEAGVQLALLDEEAGNIKAARERLENIVRQNPFSVDAHFQLGRFYFNQKEYDNAIGQFRSVITLYPNHSNSYYSLGLSYQMKGNKEKAIKQFEKVLELNPGNQEVEQRIENLRRGGSEEGETEETENNTENQEGNSTSTTE